MFSFFSELILGLLDSLLVQFSDHLIASLLSEEGMSIRINGREGARGCSFTGDHRNNRFLFNKV